MCGLFLFKRNGVDNDRIVDLKQDIAFLQSQGVMVKLAFGGESYGNMRIALKVTKAYLIVTAHVYMSGKGITPVL